MYVTASSAACALSVSVLSVTLTDLILDVWWLRSHTLLTSLTSPGTLVSQALVWEEKHVVEIAFKVTWFNKWNWLHYDEAVDAAFFHVCATASQYGKLKQHRKTWRLYREAFLTGRMPQKDFDDTNMNILINRTI